MPHDACGTDKGGTQEDALDRVSHHTLPWFIENKLPSRTPPRLRGGAPNEMIGEILIEAAGRFKAAIGCRQECRERDVASRPADLIL
jgi:hypothetical protein